ncbi:unnamed protein product [Linum tenue]|uniref:Uncharacterized protein n=1 Tax=Linum tenue TaxID=586396 RepID=A0AAV0I2J5_9ROSI|nr:unnamed protein product [Linum tenue]
MNFVNKLGLVLTVVFVISLVFLSLQILYLLWRKRRFQQTEFGSSGGGDHHHHDQASALSPSKELLYFFCWKNYQASRIEPADAAAVSVGVVPAAASAPTEEDEELEEMLKLHQLYGASRALFTIKEETEREEIENDSASSLPRNAVVTAETMKKTTDTAREVVVVIDFDGESDDDDEATLFRTPCGSPPYYTPSPSPPRDQDRQDPEARLITVKIAGR